MPDQMNDMDIEPIAQTNEYIAWTNDEDDGSLSYAVELGRVTIYIFQEEWDEMLTLLEDARVQIASGQKGASGDDLQTETIAETEEYVAWTTIEPDGEKTYHVELGFATLHFFQEEWDELLELIGQVTGKGKKKGKQ